MNEPSVTYLRRISKAVFVACEEPVAADISNHLIWAAARIEALEAALRWIADMPWTADHSMMVMQIGAINQRIRAALAEEQDK